MVAPPAPPGASRARGPRRARTWALAALAGAVAAGLGTVAGIRLVASPPPLTVTATAARELVASPGIPRPIMLPPRGSLSVDSDADGQLGSLDPATPRPIASVAKAMTALSVVDAHPLGVDEEGPVVTLTAADVDLYRAAVAVDGSALAVTDGERLTERQLLLGLMLPSANNLADTLARWVDGSTPGFVARMNRMAATLGMAHTHFADASGFSPQTVSSTADLVILGRAVLAAPALAAVVSTRSATLPDGTPLTNLDTLLSTETGWLGIKTGSTPQAGGCLLFAARRPVGGAVVPVTVVGAVLGQTDRAAALAAARDAVDSAFAGYSTIDLGSLPVAIGGDVHGAWGSASALEAGPGPADRVELRQGRKVVVSIAAAAPGAPLPAGGRVGTVTLSLGGHTARRPLVAAAAVAGPGVGWRLVHT